MPFIAVRCPNCAGEIQLDDTREFGYCLFCGGKVVYKEAIQQMKLSGSVTVQPNIESILKSAGGFLALEKFYEAEELYEKVIVLDSTDYRGWWGLFLSRTQNLHYCPFRYADYSFLYKNDANNAIKLAPDNKKAELNSTLTSYLIFFNEQMKIPKRRQEQIEEKIKENEQREEERLDALREDYSQREEKQRKEAELDQRVLAFRKLLGVLMICAGPVFSIWGVSNDWFNPDNTGSTLIVLMILFIVGLFVLAFALSE